MLKGMVRTGDPGGPGEPRGPSKPLGPYEKSEAMSCMNEYILSGQLCPLVDSFINGRSDIIVMLGLKTILFQHIIITCFG